MSENLEEFRDAWLAEARSRLIAIDPVAASPSELIMASALLKQYDFVDQYIGLTPERTAMILEMSAADFGAWIALPRNQFALAQTLSDPVAVEIIFRDASGATVITGDAAAMTVIAASNAVMTTIVASNAAMKAVADSSVAMTVIAANATAMAAVTTSSVAMTAVVISPVAMAAIWGNDTARAILQANSDAITLFTGVDANTGLFAACVLADIDPSQFADAAAVLASPVAMTAIWGTTELRGGWNLLLAVPLANSAFANSSNNVCLFAACVLANIDPSQFADVAAVLASPVAMTAIANTQMAIKMICFHSGAMTAVALNAIALNAAAKSAIARSEFCLSPFLQDRATDIKNTLTSAPTSLFVVKSTSVALTAIYGTRCGVVGYVNDVYTTEVSSSSSLRSGGLFVLVKTGGLFEGSASNSLSLFIKHLQSNTPAKEIPLNGAYQTKNVNAICVGGLAVNSNSTSSSQGGVVFDAWEAV